MDFSQPAFIAAWVGSVSFVWVLFDRAEKVRSAEAREAASRWLKNLSVDLSQRWPSQFVLLFDGIFGERHLSFKCFFRSCIASIISVSILLLVYLWLHPVCLTALLRKKEIFLGIYFFAAILNLIPDYFSLLETRIVIQRMTRSTPTSIVFLLFVDFIVTNLIFLSGFSLFYFVLGSAFYPVLVDIEPDLLANLPYLFSFAPSNRDPEYISNGIYLYSTYFTSVWLWLYVISGILVRTVASFGSLFEWLKKVLDIENQPFRCIGFVSMFLVSLGFLVLLFLK